MGKLSRPAKPKPFVLGAAAREVAMRLAPAAQTTPRATLRWNQMIVFKRGRKCQLGREMKSIKQGSRRPAVRHGLVQPRHRQPASSLGIACGHGASSVLFAMASLGFRLVFARFTGFRREGERNG